MGLTGAREVAGERLDDACLEILRTAGGSCSDEANLALEPVAGRGLWLGREVLYAPIGAGAES